MRSPTRATGQLWLWYGREQLKGAKMNRFFRACTALTVGLCLFGFASTSAWAAPKVRTTKVTVKAKVSKSGRAMRLKAKASVVRKARESSKFVVVGSFVDKKLGKLTLRCRGKKLKCHALDGDGTVLPMEGESTDECECGPNGDMRCPGDPPGSCGPESEPTAPNSIKTGAR